MAVQGTRLGHKEQVSQRSPLCFECDLAVAGGGGLVVVGRLMKEGDSWDERTRGAAESSGKRRLICNGACGKKEGRESSSCCCVDRTLDRRTNLTEADLCSSIAAAVIQLPQKVEFSHRLLWEKSHSM